MKPRRLTTKVGARESALVLCWRACHRLITQDLLGALLPFIADIEKQFAGEQRKAARAMARPHQREKKDLSSRRPLRPA